MASKKNEQLLIRSLKKTTEKYNSVDAEAIKKKVGRPRKHAPGSYGLHGGFERKTTILSKKQIADMKAIALTRGIKLTHAYQEAIQRYIDEDLKQKMTEANEANAGELHTSFANSLSVGNQPKKRTSKD